MRASTRPLATRGTYILARPGVHLIIGGVGINDYTHEVIGLAELRQIRDHLTAILADTRLTAVMVRVEGGVPLKRAA